VEVPGVQVVAHALPLHPRLPPHATIVGPEAQLPVPLHWVSLVSIPPEQETVLEHAVPAGATAHAPVPAAQAPVSPHGGLVTVQLAAQQTPLLPQSPLVHSSPAVQVPVPLPSLGTHAPVRQ
jgi:hypothetical protein